jgi:hypothetical protein
MGNNKESMEQIGYEINWKDGTTTKMVDAKIVTEKTKTIMKTETTTEFAMLYKGILEPFEDWFSWVAWTDCYDISDSLSSFTDWDYELVEVSYTTEDGEHIVLSNAEYNALNPEYKDLIEYNIESEIETQVL